MFAATPINAIYLKIFYLSKIYLAEQKYECE